MCHHTRPPLSHIRLRLYSLWTHLCDLYRAESPVHVCARASEGECSAATPPPALPPHSPPPPQSPPHSDTTTTTHHARSPKNTNHLVGLLDVERPTARRALGQPAAGLDALREAELVEAVRVQPVRRTRGGWWQWWVVAAAARTRVAARRCTSAHRRAHTTRHDTHGARARIGEHAPGALCVRRAPLTCGHTRARRT